MKPLYSAQQMRNLDKKTIEEVGIPGVVLMEHAGFKSAQIIKRLWGDGSNRVVVVCGKGNNGGDGYVIARWLSHWGWDVQVFSLAKPKELKGDAKINFEAFYKLYPDRFHVLEGITPLEDALSKANLVVDAILGTGITKPVSGYFEEVIFSINQCQKPVFSVDIPSGLPSDSGKVIGTTVKATVTATYGGLKRAHFVYPAKSFVGKVFLVDIGIPPAVEREEEVNCFLIEEEDVKALFPTRIRTSHKGDYGHLCIICGSPGKTGAGIMAAEAALRVGTGLVTLFVPESLNPTFETSTVEAMSLPLPDNEGFLSPEAYETIKKELERKSAIAIGPGLGQHEGTGLLLRRIIESTALPMVIDADGINLIAKDPSIWERRRAPIILTPHPGEFSRLTGIPTTEVNERRLEIALEWAEKLNVIIVLKGASTIVATPEGKAFVNPTGNPGMASGGSGDVLTGIIGGLLAMGIEPVAAAAGGVFLHGLCGDVAAKEVGEYPLTATDMIDALPFIIKSWEKGEQVWEKAYTIW